MLVVGEDNIVREAQEVQNGGRLKFTGCFGKTFDASKYIPVKEDSVGTPYYHNSLKILDKFVVITEYDGTVWAYYDNPTVSLSAYIKRTFNIVITETQLDGIFNGMLNHSLAYRLGASGDTILVITKGNLIHVDGKPKDKLRILLEFIKSIK